MLGGDYCLCYSVMVLIGRTPATGSKDQLAALLTRRVASLSGEAHRTNTSHLVAQIMREYQTHAPTDRSHNTSALYAWMWQQINADVCVVCPTKYLADNITRMAHSGGPTPYVYLYAGPTADGMAPHYSSTCHLSRIQGTDASMIAIASGHWIDCNLSSACA
jgi:hypothetical protein